MKGKKGGHLVALYIFLMLVMSVFVGVGVGAADTDALSEHYFEDFLGYYVGNTSVDNGWLEFNNSNAPIKAVRGTYGDIEDKKIVLDGDHSFANLKLNLTHSFDYVIGSRIVWGLEEYDAGDAYHTVTWRAGTDNIVVAFVTHNLTSVTVKMGTATSSNITSFTTTNYTRTSLLAGTLIKIDFTVLNDEEISFGCMIGSDVFGRIIDNGWEANNTYNITNVVVQYFAENSNVSIYSLDVICADDWYENVFLDNNNLLKFLGTEHESPKHDWYDEDTRDFRVMRTGTAYQNVMLNEYNYNNGFNGYLEEFRVLLCGYQETAQGTDAMNKYHFDELRLGVKGSGTTVPENGFVYGKPSAVQRVTGKFEIANSISMPIYELSWTDLDFRIEDGGSGNIRFNVIWPHDTFIVSGINFYVYGLQTSRHYDFDKDGDKRTDFLYGTGTSGFEHRGYVMRDCMYHFGWNSFTVEDNVITTYMDKSSYVEGDPCLFEWQRTAGDTDWSFGVRDAADDWVYIKTFAFGTNNQDTNTLSGYIPFGYDTSGQWDLVYRNRLAASWTIGSSFSVSQSARTYKFLSIGDRFPAGVYVYANVEAPNSEQVWLHIWDRSGGSSGTLIDNISYVGRGNVENISIGRFVNVGGYAIQMFKADGSHATNKQYFTVETGSEPPGGRFSITSLRENYDSGSHVVLYGYNPHLYQDVLVVGKHTKREVPLNCSHEEFDVDFEWRADDVWSVYLLNGDKRSASPVYMFYVGEQYWPGAIDDDADDEDMYVGIPVSTWTAAIGGVIVLGCAFIPVAFGAKHKYHIDMYVVLLFAVFGIAISIWLGLWPLWLVYVFVLMIIAYFVYMLLRS